jgi:hypothetical protein
MISSRLAGLAGGKVARRGFPGPGPGCGLGGRRRAAPGWVQMLGRLSEMGHGPKSLARLLLGHGPSTTAAGPTCRVGCRPVFATWAADHAEREWAFGRVSWASGQRTVAFFFQKPS